MKALKYILAGAMAIGSYTASFAQQDVKAQIDAITKVIADNKKDLKAAEPLVKDYVKANKKNAEALVGLGRAYLAIKDTLNSKKYGEMAVKVNMVTVGYFLVTSKHLRTTVVLPHSSISRQYILTRRTLRDISSMPGFTAEEVPSRL